MGSRNVVTLGPAIVVLNDCDIGSTFHHYQKHQSFEFSFEQHSPLRWVYTKTENHYDSVSCHGSDHRVLD